MFEIMSLRRTSAPPPPDNGPRFPLYLLPTIRVPFRRRRDSEPGQEYSPPTISEPASPQSPIPSLSSSPGSIGSGSPTSPTSPKTSRHFFPYTPRATLFRAQPDTLRCAGCATDLAYHAQIVSKGFMGRHGRAYLVSPPSAQPTPSCPRSPLNPGPEAGTAEATDLINIRVGRPEDRQLVTGPHVVADISCVGCGTVVGWKYVDAKDAAQKYKVGKFILETRKVVGFRSWEDASHSSSYPKGVNTWYSGEEDGDGESVTVFDSQDEDECEDIFAGVWDAKLAARRRRSKVANMRREAAGATA
ncbi:Protein yippee-like [Madurella mycetomatis]|uniref:Protein yippee-like n=1 Tax=Madurella mycetomatis TaxID=100816 RepID=A0A175W887_9PEZI|nr:Protein yippee-like [Madurella mycetomatis]